MSKVFRNSLFIFIFFFGLFLHSLPVILAAGQPVSVCGCDAGEGTYGKCFISGTNIPDPYEKECPGDAPYCIADFCYREQNNIREKCGEGPDCKSGVCTSANVCGGQPAPLDCEKIQFQNSCDNQSHCFWYSGGTEWTKPRCVVNSGNMGAYCGTGHCYNTQLCGQGGTCYRQGDTPPAPEPIGEGEDPTWNCGAGQNCVAGETCVQTSSSNSKHICIPTRSRGPGEHCKKSIAGNVPNGNACTSGNCDPSTFTCNARGVGQSAGDTPGRGGAYITPCSGSCGTQSSPPPASGCAGNNWYYESSGDSWCQANGGGNNYCYACSASAGPQEPGVGYCADGNRKNEVAIGGATCGVGNASYDSSGDNYCNVKHGGSLGNFYRCPGTSDPGNGSGDGGGDGGNTTNPPTLPEGPPSGPCAKERGGIDTSYTDSAFKNGYDNSYCNKEPYFADRAANRSYCGGTYTDRYMCRDGKEHHFAPTFTDATNPCNRSPWCPQAVTTPAPDANCKAYQGQTCKPGDLSDANYCCQANKNLECVDPAKRGIYTCQYIGGAAFTPTPGSKSTTTCAEEKASGLGMSLGCACPLGGPCKSGLSCRVAADGVSGDMRTYYCTGESAWCSNTQTPVKNLTQTCEGAPAYQSPTPTPVPPKDLGYQADCPANNGNNACLSSCTNGYIPNPVTGPGGTKGDDICSEAVSSGFKCCTKNPVSSGGGSTGGGTGGNSGNNNSGNGSGSTTNPAPSTPSEPLCAGSSTPTSACTKSNGQPGAWQWDGKDSGTSGCETNPNTYKYICQ